MDITEAADKGRFGDTFLAHLSSRERVIPPKEYFPPEVNEQIDISLEALGLPTKRYEVGAKENSINPETGLPEFGILGDVFNVVGLGGSPQEEAADSQQDFFEALPQYFWGSDEVPQAVLEGLYLPTSTATSPFGTGTYGPSGASFQLSPQMQALYDQGYGQAMSTGNLLDRYTQGNLFSNKNPLYRALSDAANRQTADELLDLKNLISAGWNRSGSTTGEGRRQAHAVNLFQQAANQRRAGVIADTLAGAGALQNMRSNDLNYLANIGGLASPLTGQAQGLSNQLFGIEANKLGQYLGAMQDWRTLQGQIPTWQSSLSNIADTALGFYAGGGGFSPRGTRMTPRGSIPTGQPFSWQQAFDRMYPQQHNIDFSSLIT